MNDPPAADVDLPVRASIFRHRRHRRRSCRLRHHQHRTRPTETTSQRPTPPSCLNRDPMFTNLRRPSITPVSAAPSDFSTSRFFFFYFSRSHRLSINLSTVAPVLLPQFRRFRVDKRRLLSFLTDFQVPSNINSDPNFPNNNCQKLNQFSTRVFLFKKNVLSWTFSLLLLAERVKPNRCLVATLPHSYCKGSHFLFYSDHLSLVCVCVWRL